MVGAMACFIVNDTLTKVASATLPSGQLIFLRGLIATALIVLWLRFAESAPALRPRRLASGPVAARATLDALSTLTYLISLFNLPIASATAINMATPLIITLLAALWLHLRVTGARAAAIALGFGGVLLVIQPSTEGLNAYAWLCLAAALFGAMRDLVTLRIPREVPSTAVTLATSVAVTLFALALSLAQGWSAFTWVQLMPLAAAAVFLATGYQLIVRATRASDPSVVAPFRYSGLLMAVAIGWGVWGEVPNALAWAGIALVIAAGLYLLREGHR
jgi:drug/metabolite transporter (DMT)-like permease